MSRTNALEFYTDLVRAGVKIAVDGGEASFRSVSGNPIPAEHLIREDARRLDFLAVVKEWTL